MRTSFRPFRPSRPSGPSGRARRVFAAVTAAALAASLGVAIAPSATAFYGAESTVKAAVLTTANIATAAGWDTTANPLTGSYTHNDTYDWDNSVTPTTPITTAQVAPEYAELVLASSPTTRPTLYTQGASYYLSNADAVISSTATSFVVQNNLPDGVETLSARYAGSDGIAVGGCITTTVATTTTTVGERTACANGIAAAQAAAWAKVSPNLVFKTSSAVTGRMLTSAQAHSAASLPSKATTKVLSTKSITDKIGGRGVTRKFQTSADLTRLRISLPVKVSLMQYGNRTNGHAAFVKTKAADDKATRLYDVTSSSYSVAVNTTLLGRSTRVAATVSTYADIVVITSCVGNPYKKPSDAALRLCSKRLAAAEITKAKSLFSAIK